MQNDTWMQRERLKGLSILLADQITIIKNAMSI